MTTKVNSMRLFSFLLVDTIRNLRLTGDMSNLVSIFLLFYDSNGFLGKNLSRILKV